MTPERITMELPNAGHLVITIFITMFEFSNQSDFSLDNLKMPTSFPKKNKVTIPVTPRLADPPSAPLLGASLPTNSARRA